MNGSSARRICNRAEAVMIMNKETKKKKPPIPETAYAEILVGWLMKQGWEVYQEIPIAYGRTVDICCIKRDTRESWLIEVKTSINYKLRRQAEHCQYASKHVSTAVPLPKRLVPARNEFIKTLAEDGIGFLHIDLKNKTVEVVTEPTEKRKWRDIYRHEENDLLFTLPEEFKTFCAAGSRGGFLTAFKMTCMNVVEYVREHPGCTMREAVRGIEHHYGNDNTAVSCLNAIGIKDIEFRVCLYVKEPKQGDLFSD